LISRYTFLGLFKWLWLKIRGHRIVVCGNCKICGLCCRDLNLTNGDHWIRSKDEFKLLVEKKPEYSRFIHTGYTPGGIMVFSCECIGSDGLCGDYENRPDFCRTYPETDLYFMGGELPDHCGFSFKVMPSFDRILERESNRSANNPRNIDIE